MFEYGAVPIVCSKIAHICLEKCLRKTDPRPHTLDQGVQLLYIFYWSGRTNDRIICSKEMTLREALLTHTIAVWEWDRHSILPPLSLFLARSHLCI